MEKGNIYDDIKEVDREKLIDVLTDELPVLRAKIRLSQEELSTIIGVSRQTYSAIEKKKRKMMWSTFLTLILLFEHNEKTKPTLNSIGTFPVELEKLLNVNRRSV